MPGFWRFVPQAVTESLEFYTDVRTTPDGEMRDSIKDATRHLELRFTRVHREAEALLEIMRADPLIEWVVPIWPEWSLGGALEIGDDVITCDTDASYRVGGYVFIGNSAAGEFGVVASIGSGTITLVDGVAAAYAAPRVAPAEQCYAPFGTGVSKTWPVADLSIEFMSLEPIDISASPYPTHEGFPVVTDPGVMTQPLNGSLSQESKLLMSRMGVYAMGEVESYVRRAATIEFLDQANHWTRRAFLHYARGRDAAFWVPTWQNDLPLTAPASSGDLTLSVTALTATGAQMVGRTIQIKTPDGTLVHRTVTAATNLLGVTTLTIAAPGVAVPADSKVSLMHLYRFDTDTFTLTHLFPEGGLITGFSAPLIEVLE